MLRRALEFIGLGQNLYDECVFSKTVDGVQLSVAFHMDDQLITSESQALIGELVNLLHKEFTDMKMNIGANHTYLGMYYDFSKYGKLIITLEG